MSAIAEQVEWSVPGYPVPADVHVGRDAIFREPLPALRANFPEWGAETERMIDGGEDVAVIGYDDVMIARVATPPLTTIRQNIALGANLMAERLFQLIEGQTAGSIAIQPELIVRASA